MSISEWLILVQFLRKPTEISRNLRKVLFWHGRNYWIRKRILCPYRDRSGLRGWWGDPWGFESPLRHQAKFAGAQRTWAPFLFRLVLCGTRTGEGADEQEEK